MKTIFLTTYDRIQIKNLLRTEFISELVQAGVRTILFVPDHKLEYYRREFAGPMVIVEGIKLPKQTRIQFLVDLAAQAALHTTSVWSFYVQRARVSRKYGKYALYLLSYMFLANPLGRGFIRFLNARLAPRDVYTKYFDRYRPDLVFVSNITAPMDRVITREAQKRGILVLGANKSWDTLSSKGYLDIRADVVLAQNDLQADELRRLQHYRGKIIVAGYPWFDFFLDRAGLRSREQFCSETGLDPNKKTIFYFLSAKFINPFPEEQIEILNELIEQGSIAGPVQILVTPRPKYDFDVDRVRRLKNVVVYMPHKGTRGTALDWEEVSRQDIEDFRNQTWHADLIVNASSTMSIEGALMDKPIISLNFDPKPVNYWASVKVRHQDYHWLRLMESGGVTEVTNSDQLAEWASRYLAWPETKQQERLRLTRQQNHFVTPDSAHRWAGIVLELLSQRMSR